MSNRELIDKLRRNPRGVMFELEHECADALEKAEAELAAIKAALIEFHAAYVAGGWAADGIEERHAEALRNVREEE